MRALQTVLLLGAIFASPLAAIAETGSTDCVLFKKFPKDSVGDFYRRDILPVLAPRHWQNRNRFDSGNPGLPGTNLDLMSPPFLCTYAVFRPVLIDPDFELCLAYLSDDLQGGIQHSDRIVLEDAKACKNFYNRAAFKFLLKDLVGARADLNTCLKLWYNEFGDLGPHQADERRLAIEKLDRKVCQALLHFSVAEGKGAFEKEVDIQNSPRGCHFPYFKPALIDAEADLCLSYLNENPEKGIKQLNRVICKDSESSSNFYNRAAFKYLAKDCTGARSDLNTCLILWKKENSSLDSMEADIRRFAIEELDRNISQALLFWKK